MMLQGDLCKENVTKAYPSLIPCDGLSFDEENLPFRDNTFDLVLTSLRFVYFAETIFSQLNFISSFFQLQSPLGQRPSRIFL